MKCIYYLAPTLRSTHQISDDLHEAGVKDWFFHVISNDEDGLFKEKIHSSNYLETLDLLRDGLIGAGVGFVAGVLAAATAVGYFEVFGPTPPAIAYIGIVLLLTMFGAWEGGLIGVASENKKLAKFHDEIEAGKYLILLYIKKDQEELVREMMKVKHPEARLSAIDTHFMNPLSKLVRI